MKCRNCTHEIERCKCGQVTCLGWKHNAAAMFVHHCWVEISPDRLIAREGMIAQPDDLAWMIQKALGAEL